MPAATKKGAPPSRKGPKTKEDKTLKRKREQEDFTKLDAAVNDLDPKNAAIKAFTDLPLSTPTASGLRASHFETLTDIQARAIPLALKGRDILGAAKTGSGKTLAFLIPVLEKLYRARWTEFDGLGALVIAPTRELAVQIFDVLRAIGRHHMFSAGLVIGGKSLKEEAERLGRMNILVCTPGRMLQHLDQTAGFEVDNLQILVLDEADRIMDMGFQSAVDALVEHLPKSRQTLLFSATQSKKVSDLARLSLKDPEYVAVHEAAASATPSNLQQHYIITPLPEKIDTLFGFIRANVNSKMIVFLSSGKQVRFVYEAFKHLQPGIPLLHLHGRQKQLARLEITRRFTTAKHSCLFATDVVARGVDFPAVDWVVQVDFPSDADEYIHRVGRTARYESSGRAVLFLDPSEEEGALKRLQAKKIPIQKVNVREKKKKSIKNELQSLCWNQSDIKYLGQKAFISYTRSVHLQKDKEIFKLGELDLDGFAASMGLPGTPQIRFQKGEDAKRIKNAPRAALSSGSESEGEDGAGRKRKKDEVRTKVQKMVERTNQDVLSSHYRRVLGDDGEGEGGDADFFSAKRVLNDEDLGDVSASANGGDEDGPSSLGPAPGKVVDLGGEQQLVVDSKRREKMLKSKKQMLKFKGHGQKLVFDDEGNAHALYELQDEDEFRRLGPVEEQIERFVAAEAGRAKEADAEDKELAKLKRREKRARRKEREAEERGDVRPAAARAAQLEAAEDEGDPLALLRSLPIAGEEEGEREEEEEERPAKRAKKWFEKDEDDESKTMKKAKGGKKVFEMAEEPDTLEDLEALAAGLLED
ncbi:RNA helicase [Pleurostoma richardsiae]|uniref:ATP-dependent RNA helicase n=1 Tax=Pleurostoma richardsiae TaxID=41990 RepID=A0AA38RMA8_9PEZI|nr:RNA helicase [Pleurostoma richardsiae]